jgi:polyferredoxin
MRNNPAARDALYQPQPVFDLLRVRGLGRLLRWRWGRLVFQLPLLALALLMIYDGFTGPRLASQNIATVAAWVHYRGLVILALLLVGNLFCMSCPFTLPRTVARKLSGRGRRWPRALRTKWLAIVLFVGIFWLYEWLDLWASPWLTAWLAIAYFAAAFTLEAIFAESPFCKYLCPLGTFNFAGSTISPFQITTRSREVCRTCVGKECVNGSTQVLGCGTELFVPQVQSNLDCVFCLDCARACPYDNVALAARKPLAELTRDAWPQRWDVAFLIFVFAFASLTNAFGMVPPVYALEAWLGRLLGTANEAFLLAIILGVGMLLVPAVFGIGAAWLSRALAGGSAAAPARRTAEVETAAQPQPVALEPLRVVFARYAPAMMPLAFSIWFAHYGFHFATGALTIVPVVQHFLLDHGIALLGAPHWSLGPILPAAWLLPLETGVVLLGFLGSLVVADRIARRACLDLARARRATLPWLGLLLLLAFAAIAIFTLPMEMRGAPGLVG